ncbi:MAG: hypothetical protein DWQ36_15045 [Acidobacteria bacterium]|nr:MAG: hypothetical protein DWQ30_00145 [Acidobacteriota bacterium]REK06208.1 MAG: hypothetical protein DWQ36_15045 [Acidobacteriota bacterium]
MTQRSTRIERPPHPRSRPSTATRALVLLSALPILLAATASAQETQPLGCGLQNQPAATVLLPYFEVDLQDPQGRTTLFSVGNAADDYKLAHATVWTNWGQPVYSFDFFVAPGGVQSFNLRDVLDGNIPETSDPDVAALYASCTAPLAQPALDPAALRSVLTGLPHPGDGLCYAQGVEEGAVATGYVTVDVVQDCSGSSLMTPQDAGYLGDCATGLASNENVLWGDFFLVDPSENSAQGESLVSLVADQARFGVPFLCVDPPCGWRIGETFHAPDGNRMPLPSAFETRFLNGGGFDGGTDLLLWLDGALGPMACDQVATMVDPMTVEVDLRGEHGGSIGQTAFYAGARARRVRVGGEDLPVSEPFGLMRLRAHSQAGGGSGGGGVGEERQLFVVPLFSASGRYSVGTRSAPVADFCAIDGE